MFPIIGITTYGRSEKEVVSESYDAHFAIPTPYVDAVRRADGVPILLPPGEPNLSAWLDLLDGIIFSGGADISPKYYSGDESHPKLGLPDPERDQTEFALLDLALRRKALPILMICRGMQLLNTAMKGDLHEHIADVHPDNIHQGKDSFWTQQEYTIENGSLLATIAKQEKQSARSGHHQGVKSVGNNLTVAALAADGIVEAIEHTDHPFCLGVQWHPEATAATDASQQEIFNAFVKASATR